MVAAQASKNMKFNDPWPNRFDKRYIDLFEGGFSNKIQKQWKH